MFDKIVSRVKSFALDVVANVLAWQVNERYEKAALRLLEQVHTGASLEWVSELVETRGRHALAVAHH
jgi:hypothetical protein